jgi:hypothetical protein
MGRNALYGPGFRQMSGAVYKEFRVTERVKAEFRAESPNVTNSPRWSNPGSGSGSMVLNPDGSLRTLNNFMCITSVVTGAGGERLERQIRFGLRFQF